MIQMLLSSTSLYVMHLC